MSGQRAPRGDLTMTLVPGREAVEAADDPEKLDALYRQICAALGIDPQPDDDDDDVDDAEPDKYQDDDRSDEEDDPTR